MSTRQSDYPRPAVRRLLPGDQQMTASGATRTFSISHHKPHRSPRPRGCALEPAPSHQRSPTLGRVLFHEPCKRADDLDADGRPGLVRHGFDLDPLDEVPDGFGHGLAGRLAGGRVGRQGRVDVLDLAGVGLGRAGVQLNRQLCSGAVDFLQLGLDLGFLSFELGQPLGDR